MKRMSLLLALLVLVGAAQPVENPSAIVARHWAQYSGWVTIRDVESLTNLFAPQARVMQSGLDDIIGPEAIRSLFTAAFAQRVRPVDVRMMPREVNAYEGVIYELGDYVQTMAPQDNPRACVRHLRPLFRRLGPAVRLRLEDCTPHASAEETTRRPLALLAGSMPFVCTAATSETT